MTARWNELSDEALGRLDAMVRAARVRIFIDTEEFLRKHKLPSSYVISLRFFHKHMIHETAVYQITPIDKVRIL